MSIVFHLERTHQLSLLPDKDLVNLCPPIEPYQVTKSQKPFPTFAVSVSGGGAMIPVYSKERRHLSLLEIKRLMGFPDDYYFPVSRTAAIKQLSNAVCPPVIKHIGINITKSLN